MQQDVRQMMSPRLEAVELAIEHVRDGGERMPVGSMNMSERPLDRAKREPIRDLGILVNVLPVIIADELMVNDLPEGHPDDCRKENADDPAG